MIILSLVLPLITFLILFFSSFIFGREAKYLAVILPTIGLFDLVIYVFLTNANTTVLVLGHWFNLDYITALWIMVFSPFTLLTASIVLLLSILIQLYSLSYMDLDLNIILFLAYMCLFSFFMIWFLYTNNLLLNLIGWEGIGFLSYLLINFWSVRIESNKASLKAIFINKIGDMFFLLSIVFTLHTFYTINTVPVNSLAVYFQKEYITFIAITISIINLIVIGLIVAACTKSAQLFFNLWLADAMEGPTPVSSLIHSATMVAAGFFLLLKYNALLEQTPITLPLLFWIGFVTSLTATLESLSVFDSKSALASSTCDQLGMVFTIYGCGNWELAYFQFYNHAFYKSLAFLCLGVLSHQSGEQAGSTCTVLVKQNSLVLAHHFLVAIASMGFPMVISHYSKAILINMHVVEKLVLTQFVWSIVQLLQIINNINILLSFIGLVVLADSLQHRKPYMHRRHIAPITPQIAITLNILGFIVLLSGFISNYVNKYQCVLTESTLRGSYWLMTYFLPKSYLLINYISFFLVILFVYWYTTYTHTLISLYYTDIKKFKSINLSVFNPTGDNPVDYSLNLISLCITSWSYDVGYLALSNGLFNLNFYLKYILYYNFYVALLTKNPLSLFVIINITSISVFAVTSLYTF